MKTKIERTYWVRIEDETGGGWATWLVLSGETEQAVDQALTEWLIRHTEGGETATYKLVA